MKLLVNALLSIVLVFSLVTSAYAYDLDFSSQAEFDSFSQQVGTLITYRAMAPAEPGGLLGFDVSLAASGVKIDSALWDLVIQNENVTSDYIAVPSLRARLGLPLSFDVGASYSVVPGTDVQVLGGELQWALWDGSVAKPALAFRGHYSKLFGVNDLEQTSYGADVVLSKGFAMFTPYIGIGAVAMEGKYTGPLALGLDTYSDTSPRYFGGLLMTITLLQITADIECLEEPVYSLKVGLGW